MTVREPNLIDEKKHEADTQTKALIPKCQTPKAVLTSFIAAIASAR